MENPRIRNFMNVTSFDAVVKAIIEYEERLNFAEELLENILANNKSCEDMSTDIMDLLYTVSLTYYAKGIKDGSKLSNTLFWRV